MLIDISARKIAEQQLVAAKEQAEEGSRAKSQFLSRMSHELRTPLNAILGFAQVLKLKPIDEEQRFCADEILQAGHHLLQLIDELLELSRIEAGKLVATMAPVRLADVVAQALRMLRTAIDRRGSLVVNETPGDAWVLADETRLRQILVNLISNAIKYSPPGGRIDIACQLAEAGRRRVAISDNGPGIAPEQMSLLFTPFERLGAEHSDVQGTGIGLALSRKLAELMDAQLGVESTVDQGSTFWLDLRVATELAAERETKEVDAGLVASNGVAATVLYIEDNPANMRLMEALFRYRPELTLLAATSGAQGITSAKQHRPDLILLDINLPDMDGYAVFYMLRAEPLTRDIPVIALSADATAADIERGMQVGFRAYLTKPVMLNEVLGAIEAALIQSHAHPFR